MERMKKFTAGPMDDGLRVDKAVLLHLAGVSRARLQQCIEEGLVRVNGRSVKSSGKLRPGDKVTVELAPRPAPEMVAQEIPLNIMYRDDHLAVINKPAGLVVHPGAGVADGTLANALLHHFGELPGTRELRPGIVHRLDKETSGLLLVTLTEESQLKIAAMFQERKLVKEYCALVYGGMESQAGTIDKPIGRHPVHRTKMTTRAPRSRPCLTEWQVEREYPGYTLLRIILHTGRTHQIRVHLSSNGHPVVGDTVYGGSRHLQIRQPELRRAITGMHRFFLHARRLRFIHPFLRKEMNFEAPLPPELNAVLEALEESRRR